MFRFLNNNDWLSINPISIILQMRVEQEYTLFTGFILKNDKTHFIIKSVSFST